MEESKNRRQIYGDNAVLKKCQGDRKFAYIVALARAVNALNSAHSLMVTTGDKGTAAAERDRMNSYFFSSAIVYESLKLIKTMGSEYGKERIFQDSLQTLLKDRTAQDLEQEHLKAARHDATFHYLPDRFANAIAKTGMTDCVFTATSGDKRGDIHYEFADFIAAEMEVGGRLDNESTVRGMMQKKLELVKKLISYSEDFIAYQLNTWGFKIRPI